MLPRLAGSLLALACWLGAEPASSGALAGPLPIRPSGLAHARPSRPGGAREPARAEEGVRLFDVHRALGFTALGTFSSALVIGAASGNLFKLTDPAACCPDGGTRDPVWRTTDRALVNVGIVSYTGAAAIAGYNLLLGDPDRPRHTHTLHRWLAAFHGTAFLTSAVTGIIMADARDTDPERFAAAARVHVVSNVLLVPLLTLAMADIEF